MQKLICVGGGDTTELNEYLTKGWKIVSTSSCCTCCVTNNTPSFYSFCHVVIEF